MAKGNKLSIARTATVFSVFFISLALAISGIVLFAKHSNEILERSYTEARSNTLSSTVMVENKIDSYKDTVVEAAAYVSEATNAADLKDRLSHVDVMRTNLSHVRYFYDDKVYDIAGAEIKNATDDLALEYRKNEEQRACYLGTNLNFIDEDIDKNGLEQVLEFYSPVKNVYCDIDGVSIYFSLSGVKDDLGDDFTHDNTIFSTLCKRDGVVFVGVKDVDSTNIIEEVKNIIGVPETVNSLEKMLNNGESGTIPCKIHGVNHVLSVQTNPDTIADLAMVELYKCSELAKSTVDFINAIIAVIVLFILILLSFSAYFIVNHFRLQRKVNNAESYDVKLDCLNRHGFEKETEGILSRNPNLYYAAIICQIRHFKFLNESFGETEVNALLEYLKVVFTKTCRIEETYGYMGDGEFLIFLHAKDREDLLSRLKIHSFLSTQYKGNHKFDVALKYGIYEHNEEEKISTSKMIDFANEANNAIVKSTVENVDMQFNFYDQNLRKIRILNENMELRQETALKEGEFQVFYQAKYNLNTHKQDGAEALVRWYDPKTGEYNKPYLFMPLFESNGFIEKLDKYVYTKVCEYISYSLASGRNVFPVSVNVSRITATQPDFVDFYAKTKKKYGIANGALTIEFTESFAYENYDVLKDIVDKLHKYGFKTSIDDFGCGYSSYRILKELPMDEIKLDKFFIDRAEDPERVDFIFESVISLAKNLKMKVTQEGVERQEDVELLKAHGCDVIQGYIYSHPLSLTDYLAFVEHTKDHNL